MPTYSEKTIAIARKRSTEIREKFEDEVERLLKSGAVDEDAHNRGLIFGVALENIADGFTRGEKNKPEYRNLKRF